MGDCGTRVQSVTDKKTNVMVTKSSYYQWERWRLKSPDMWSGRCCHFNEIVKEKWVIKDASRQHRGSALSRPIRMGKCLLSVSGKCKWSCGLYFLLITPKESRRSIYVVRFKVYSVVTYFLFILQDVNCEWICFSFVWTACLCIKHYKMTVKQSCNIASAHCSLREVIWKLLTPVFVGVTVVNCSTAICLWKQDFQKRMVPAPMSWKVQVSQTSERNSSQILSFIELKHNLVTVGAMYHQLKVSKFDDLGSFSIISCPNSNKYHIVLTFSERAHYI